MRLNAEYHFNNIKFEFPISFVCIHYYLFCFSFLCEFESVLVGRFQPLIKWKIGWWQSISRRH